MNTAVLGDDLLGELVLAGELGVAPPSASMFSSVAAFAAEQKWGASGPRVKWGALAQDKWVALRSRVKWTSP